MYDWVPNVRAAARHALALALPAASRDDIVAALPAAYRLTQARREQHDVWLAEFERSVLALVGEERLLQEVRAADTQVARAAFRLLAHGSALQPQVLLEAVVPASSDVVLVACAFDHLAASGAGIDDSDCGCSIICTDGWRPARARTPSRTRCSAAVWRGC